MTWSSIPKINFNEQVQFLKMAPCYDIKIFAKRLKDFKHLITNFSNNPKKVQYLLKPSSKKVPRYYTIFILKPQLEYASPNLLSSLVSSLQFWVVFQFLTIFLKKLVTRCFFPKILNLTKKSVKLKFLFCGRKNDGFLEFIWLFLYHFDNFGIFLRFWDISSYFFGRL